MLFPLKSWVHCENCSSVVGTDVPAEDPAARQADLQSESLCNVIWSHFICNTNAAIRKLFINVKLYR